MDGPTQVLTENRSDVYLHGLSGVELFQSKLGASELIACCQIIRLHLFDIIVSILILDDVGPIGRRLPGFRQSPRQWNLFRKASKAEPLRHRGIQLYIRYTSPKEYA